MKSLITLCLLFSWVLFSHAEDEKLDLKMAMGDQAFKDAGLDKLTAAELEKLEYWIKTREVMTSEKAVQTAVAQKEKEVSEAAKKGFGFLNFWRSDDQVPESLRGPESIEAKIVGKFTGWSAKTKFQLDNGQVWIVSNQPKSYYIKLENPEVSIEKLGMGGHMLKVLKTGRKVRVKRIK